MFITLPELCKHRDGTLVSVIARVCADRHQFIGLADLESVEHPSTSTDVVAYFDRKEPDWVPKRKPNIGDVVVLTQFKKMTGRSRGNPILYSKRGFSSAIFYDTKMKVYNQWPKDTKGYEKGTMYYDYVQKLLWTKPSPKPEPKPSPKPEQKPASKPEPKPGTHSTLAHVFENFNPTALFNLRGKGYDGVFYDQNDWTVRLDGLPDGLLEVSNVRFLTKDPDTQHMTAKLTNKSKIVAVEDEKKKAEQKRLERERIEREQQRLERERIERQQRQQQLLQQRLLEQEKLAQQRLEEIERELDMDQLEFGGNIEQYQSHHESEGDYDEAMRLVQCIQSQKPKVVTRPRCLSLSPAPESEPSLVQESVQEPVQEPVQESEYVPEPEPMSPVQESESPVLEPESESLSISEPVSEPESPQPATPSHQSIQEPESPEPVTQSPQKPVTPTSDVESEEDKLLELSSSDTGSDDSTEHFANVQRLHNLRRQRILEQTRELEARGTLNPELESHVTTENESHVTADPVLDESHVSDPVQDESHVTDPVQDVTEAATDDDMSTTTTNHVTTTGLESHVTTSNPEHVTTNPDSQSNVNSQTPPHTPPSGPPSGLPDDIQTAFVAEVLFGSRDEEPRDEPQEDMPGTPMSRDRIFTVQQPANCSPPSGQPRVGQMDSPSRALSQFSESRDVLSQSESRDVLSQDVLTQFSESRDVELAPTQDEPSPSHTTTLSRDVIANPHDLLSHLVPSRDSRLARRTDLLNDVPLPVLKKFKKIKSESPAPLVVPCDRMSREHTPFQLTQQLPKLQFAPYAVPDVSCSYMVIQGILASCGRLESGEVFFIVADWLRGERREFVIKVDKSEEDKFFGSVELKPESMVEALSQLVYQKVKVNGAFDKGNEYWSVGNSLVLDEIS